MFISKESIQEAAERIKPFIHNTPVLTNQSINVMFGIEFYFKCENFQKIGAFKIRGGMNASLKLTTEELAKGVATHSSGNHAQAMAYAGKFLGTKAYIVMPSTSPQVKVNAVKGYGAKVIMCEPNQQASEVLVHNPNCFLVSCIALR
jgi:threonine dehydratase